MRAPLMAALCGVMVACMSTPLPSLAQEKTVKQCEDEWRANKADNQAKGINEKDYVAQCRGGTAAATTTTAPAAAPAPGAPGAAPAAGTGKTAKECRAEWQANKADNQAKGITEKAYVEQCRGGGAPASAAPSPAEMQAPATTPAPAETQTPAATPAPPPAPAARRPVTPTMPAGEGQYPTEAEARAHCPADTVVWVNLKSDVYHFSGSRNYGRTKEGAYMCEKEALSHGDRASKTEKHP